MTSPPLKVLLRAESIIQRDAIMSALETQGINCFADTRDISRKIADSTVDLAYEGYSALFDGFTIHVNEADFDKAETIARKIVETAAHAESDKTLAQGGSMRRFYFCCLFTVTMPILFHGLALYHLMSGLRQGEKLHPIYGSFSVLLLILTGGATLWVLHSIDILDTLRRLAETI